LTRFPFVQVAGQSSNMPPLLLSFLSPADLAGSLGSSLVAVEKDLQNLLTAANRCCYQVLCKRKGMDSKLVAAYGSGIFYVNLDLVTW
jgi:hypothetical protein